MEARTPARVREQFQAQFATTAIQDYVATFPPGPLAAQEYQELAADYLHAKVGERIDDPFVRNQAITQAYAEMYLANPEAYKWAGMAALASELVGDGMGTARFAKTLGSGYARSSEFAPGGQAIGDLGSRMLDGLIAGNGAVYEDIFWQHLAYEHGGVDALEQAGARGKLDDAALEGWRQIDQGIKAGNADPVWAGNRDLLRYEQYDVLQPVVYDQNRTLWAQASGRAVDWVKPLDSPMPGDRVTFQTRVPGGDIGNFRDRWSWIEGSILPAWRSSEPTLQDNLHRLATRPIR